VVYIVQPNGTGFRDNWSHFIRHSGYGGRWSLLLVWFHVLDVGVVLPFHYFIVLRCITPRSDPQWWSVLMSRTPWAPVMEATCYTLRWYWSLLDHSHRGLRYSLWECDQYLWSELTPRLWPWMASVVPARMILLPMLLLRLFSLSKSFCKPSNLYESFLDEWSDMTIRNPLWTPISAKKKAEVGASIVGFGLSRG